MNRWLGEWTSRKRRCRHPSLKLESFDSPPRGWYSIGNWRISSFSLAARITISEANSIPVVRRSRRGRTSRRTARMPQCASSTPGVEQHVQEAGEQRVADVAVVPRHRARVDVLHPVADHHVGAALEFGEEVRRLAEVVGQVGVGHQDVLAPGGSETGQVGAPVAALGLVARPARRPPRRVRRCRRSSRCRRRSPRRRCRWRRGRGGRRRTHSSIVPASSRHGITIDSRTAASVPAGIGWSVDTSSIMLDRGAVRPADRRSVRACPPPLATRRLASDRIYAQWAPSQLDQVLGRPRRRSGPAGLMPCP